MAREGLTTQAMRCMATRDRRLRGWEGERFVAYWWFVGWSHFSLGVSLCLSVPNVEIHLPFGFVRIGGNPNPGFGAWLREQVAARSAPEEDRRDG